MIAQRGFVFWLTWVNLLWQIMFNLSWNIGVSGLVEQRYGERGAALVQGVGCIVPTLIVALLVWRWTHKIGLWETRE